jgi:cell division septation protein DedD
MSRESELYKDKIEVSLDGRQIFYLFFGGAVIVGLVFVLGVMVGRRVEARGHVERAQTAAAADPLAALDRLEGNGGLTFKNTLMGKPAPTPVEQKIETAKKKPETPGADGAAAKADAKKDKAEKVDKGDSSEKAEKPEKKKSKKSDKQDKQDKPDKHDKPERDAASDGPVVTPDAVADAKPEPKARFTLQLSSFQDKHEAETFQTTLRASGFEPYITDAEVNGKTFYRVRLGTYRSLDAANDAKAEFERSAKKSASVMRL